MTIVNGEITRVVNGYSIRLDVPSISGFFLVTTDTKEGIEPHCLEILRYERQLGNLEDELPEPLELHLTEKPA